MKRIEIPGFERYSVTEDGRVFSHINNKYLKASVNGVGYLQVTLVGDNVNVKTFRVHRLVALAYVVNPNPSEYNQVNHIDANRTNAHYTNLEWCNQSLNNIHGFRVIKNRGVGSKLTDEQVRQIRRIKHLTMKQIGERFNVTSSTVNRIKLMQTYKNT